MKNVTVESINYDFIYSHFIKKYNYCISSLSDKEISIIVFDYVKAWYPCFSEDEINKTVDYIIEKYKDY